MDRKISWMTGYHDEIELVYEKAGQNESIGTLLSELEQMALKEVEESCGFLAINNKPITREMVMEMSAREKEALMYHLSGIGLMEFNPSMKEPVITVEFSSHIQAVLGCTMFSLLNRIEKTDGSYNAVLFPKATLELQLPLGGKKGMLKWEMLIMQLYPWLSVREVSSNIAADGLLTNTPGQLSNEPSKTDSEGSQKGPEKEKKGFFSRLFGKS